MRNHFHLVLETPQPNLVFGMKWLLGVYTSGEGIPKDSEAGRRQFASLMERRRAEESAADYEQIRHDWVLGSEAFRQELLDPLSAANSRRPSSGTIPSHRSPMS